MASNFLTLVSLFFLASTKVVLSSPCVAFDVNWNLLVFGLNGKDYNATGQENWGSSTAATEITATSGRPPFDSTNTTCYLAQFYNAIYVMNGDSQNPNDIYIFDAATQAWSAQSTTPGKFDFAGSQAILDHDTNVFYAVSNNELFFLNMEAETTANSTAIAWTDVEAVPFTTAGTAMALAQNHVHFLNVANDTAGDAQIFVIHFSFFQPTPQSYPVNGGGTIPKTTGQATSLFQPNGDGVQQEFVFIPSDSSAVYVINVETNTTQKLAGPTVQDPAATYFGGVTALIQLSSSGEVSYLPYTEGQDSTNAAAQWSEVKNIAAASPPGSSSSSASGSGATGGAGSSGTAKSSGTKTASGSGSTGGASGGSSSGAVSSRVTGALVASVAMFIGALLL
jgi:hypothetical protein